MAAKTKPFDPLGGRVQLPDKPWVTVRVLRDSFTLGACRVDLTDMHSIIGFEPALPSSSRVFEHELQRFVSRYPKVKSFDVGARHNGRYYDWQFVRLT